MTTALAHAVNFWSPHMSSKNSPRTLHNGLPRTNTHSWRPPTGSPSDPDVVLASLPMGTPDYLRVIGAYFAKYNSQHSKKNKGVSFKTMHDRQRMVVSFFRELRHETPYRNLDPRQLANRHIEAWWRGGWSVASPPRPSTTTSASCARSRAGSASRAWCASRSSTSAPTRRTPIDRKWPRKTAAGRP
jgi:hypothetical protein